LNKKPEGNTQGELRACSENSSNLKKKKRVSGLSRGGRQREANDLMPEFAKQNWN